MKDYSLHAIIVCTLVIVFLVIVSLLPDYSTSFFSYKRSDILSDIRMKQKLKKPDANKQITVDTLTTDSNAIKKSKAGVILPKGLVEIEDYSQDSLYLQPVYQKLNSLSSLNQPFRIAFLGDSFTECEIMTGDIREMLQEKFGGGGGGLVPLKIESAGVSPLAEVSQNSIESYSVVSKPGSYAFQCISGKYFIGRNNSEFSIRCNKFKAKAANAAFARLLFRPLHAVDITYSKDKMSWDTVHYESDPSLKMLQIDGNVNNLTFKLQQTDSIILYGVAYDNPNGVILDNLSLRSNSGLSLSSLPNSSLTEFNQQRPYDLVIIQYGLNAFNTTGNYEGYKKGMVRAINHLKSALPNARFVLFSIGDKGEMRDGEIVTNHLVPEFIQAQKEIARQSGICFWNMFEAMGGDGTIARWAQTEKPMAAKDYTHIAPAGGRIIAKQFVSSFLFEQKKYQ